MKNRVDFQRRVAAFARKDLLAIVAVIGVLACFLLAWLERARDRAGFVCCNCNLKQIGLASRIWSNDNTNLFLMSLSTNLNGAQEYVASGQTFRFFQVMSNELNTPIILTCPKDVRTPAQSFSSLSNSNLSCFVGIDANDTNPEMFLSGDRNITGGIRLPTGILEISTDDPVGWSDEMHKKFGNVAFADGSVQGLNVPSVREALRNSGMATNRLAMP